MSKKRVPQVPVPETFIRNTAQHIFFQADTSVSGVCLDLFPNKKTSAAPCEQFCQAMDHKRGSLSDRFQCVHGSANAGAEKLIF